MAIRRSAAEYGAALGDEQVTVSTVAIGITAESGAVSAMVTNGAEAIRVRWGTPTASVGHYLNPFSVLDLYQDDLSDVKFIRVGGSDSVIQVTYFG